MEFFEKREAPKKCRGVSLAILSSTKRSPLNLD